jgi:hypothetical protein
MDDNINNANAGTKKKITDFRFLKDVESKNIQCFGKRVLQKESIQSLLVILALVGKSQMSFWMALIVSKASHAVFIGKSLTWYYQTR